MPYLILHNSLLEPRPAHGNLPWLLAPAPNALVVRRLLCPHALAVGNILLQHLIERALGRCGRDIGLRDVRRWGAVGRVVGGRCLGGRRGRLVGAEDGGGCPNCARHAQGTDEHCGVAGSLLGCQLLAGGWRCEVVVKSEGPSLHASGISQREVPCQPSTSSTISASSSPLHLSGRAEDQKAR